MRILPPSGSPNWGARRTSIPKGWQLAAIRYLGNDDPTTRKAMEPILAKEEEHADDMKKLLETLSKDERFAEHS